eukprot:TRINITY_DN10822_c0_g1_i1.p1 TRINITY_DN10822_c0_g1~~TRINITY_DN10822_c0_g1_i1.p1  ORF type:complete len:766 (+),score=156.70 TRINITY_DN10822_c0_g1_i1:122-2419(+)
MFSCCKQFSGYRLAANLSHSVVFFARRPVVISWLSVDLFIAVGLVVFYWYFPDVSLLGWILTSRWIYLIVGCWHALCTLFGIVAAYRRQISQMKVFYGLFLVNLLLMIWMMIPIIDISCECGNFRQCEVLQGFALDDLNLNPIHPPDDTKVPDVERELGSESQPLVSGLEENASETKEEAGNATTQKMVATTAAATTTPTLATTLAPTTTPTTSTTPTPTTTTSSQAAPAQKGKEGQIEMHIEMPLSGQQDKKISLLETGQTDNLSTVQHHEGLHSQDDDADSELLSLDEFTGGHQRLVSKRRKRSRSLEVASSQLQVKESVVAEKDGKPDLDVDKLRKYFTARVVEKHAGACGDPVILKGLPNRAASELSKNVMPELSDEGNNKKILEELASCLLEEGCGGVLWKFEAGSDAAVDATLCTVSNSMEQNLTQETSQSSSPKTEVLIYQEKGLKQILPLKRDPEQLRHLWKILTDRLADTQIESMVRSVRKLGCRCNHAGCHPYEEADEERKYWCILDDDPVNIQNCRDSEYRIYVSSSGQHWSNDVCEKAGCHCSQIGMPPSSEFEKKHADSSRLEDGRSRYGSECAKWNGDEDHWEKGWCFVGWESTCADKVRAENDTNRQYSSKLPCGREGGQQRQRETRASELCMSLAWLGDLVCFTHIFMSLPMCFVLFKFISNRMGDVPEAEDQFAVLSSSEEDEDGEGEDDDKDSQATSENDQTPAKPADDAKPEAGEAKQATGGAASAADDGDKKQKPETDGDHGESY